MFSIFNCYSGLWTCGVVGLKPRSRTGSNLRVNSVYCIWRSRSRLRRKPGQGLLYIVIYIRHFAVEYPERECQRPVGTTVLSFQKNRLVGGRNGRDGGRRTRGSPESGERSIGTLVIESEGSANSSLRQNEQDARPAQHPC